MADTCLYGNPLGVWLRISTPVRSVANLWWADDHSWVLVTEIDFAGPMLPDSRRLIGSLLVDHRLGFLRLRSSMGRAPRNATEGRGYDQCPDVGPVHGRR